jgi:ketosteroid isomerase-like protein
MAMAPAFDFGGFKRAFEGKDASAWAACFADDGEWIEYRHHNPPRAPNRMDRRQLAEHIGRVASSPVTLVIEDEIVTDDRAAFRVIVTLPHGARIIEHVMLHLANGRITRQVDVEAWD